MKNVASSLKLLQDNRHFRHTFSLPEFRGNAKYNDRLPMSSIFPTFPSFSGKINNFETNTTFRHNLKTDVTVDWYVVEYTISISQYTPSTVG